METTNIVPAYKKGDKQILKIYHSVCPLPNCSKIFEKLFKTGDPSINQHLSKTREFYKSFDCDYEVRGVLISEVFDKFWHNSDIFKLEQNSISGNVRDILQDILNNQRQRVMLNAEVSS